MSPKLRFEVFKRDSFKCQYCGSSAPNVVLRCDHIKPVKSGGDNNISNLITACFACNSGKGATLLSDNSAVEKSYKQLAELNERREQIKMMMKWRKSLLNAKDDELNAICGHIEEVSSAKPSEDGRKMIRSWLKKYSLSQILDAVEASFAQYYDGTDDSWVKAFNKTPKICYFRSQPEMDTEMKDVFYIRAILKNRFYVSAFRASQLTEIVKKAIDLFGIDTARDCAKKCSSLAAFEDLVKPEESK